MFEERFYTKRWKEICTVFILSKRITCKYKESKKYIRIG